VGKVKNYSQTKRGKIMFEREITDQEFLNSFQSFGFAARPALSFHLCEKLQKDPDVKEHDEKAILLATLENYYFQSEIVLMLIESFHQKKENPEKSLVSIYNKIFIREGQNGEYSEALLKKIMEWNNEQLIDYLGLKKPEELIKVLTGEKREKLEEMFGSVDQAIKQAFIEIENLHKSLETLISNRIGKKEGTRIPFYKMLNKLKHGYQVVEDTEEKVLTIIVDLVEDRLDKALFKVIEIPVKKKTAYFYADQTKYIALSTQQLLWLYMMSNDV
jgi:hypothetical protein